jgi:lysophospholipase L1-like esterase
MGRRFRLDPRGALLAVGSLVAIFVVLEVGMRITAHLRLLRQGEFWAVYDPDLGYRLNPGFGDINAQGLRDHPVPPKSERFRVLVLGDSVAFYGDDVDDTYVGHLRQNLRREPGLADVEVLNAGVKGYTNYQELLYLKRDGVRLEPDLVGVGFVLNDVFRFLQLFRVEDGVIVGEGYAFTPEVLEGTSPLYRLLRKSVFLVWLRRRLSALDQSAVLGAGGDYSFEHRPDFHTAWLDEPWSDIEAQLREMKQLGEQAGFQVFLVAFPFGDQYREDYLARDREYVLKPQRKLREICTRLEIPFLDLHPLLDGARDLEDDRIHLTAEGRRRVGALVAGFLMERALLPGTRAASPAPQSD